MESPITLKLTFTVEDWVRASMAVRDRIWWVKYSFLALPVCGFLAVMMFSFLDPNKNVSDLVPLLGIGAVSALAFGLLSLLVKKVFNPWMIKRSVARQIQSSPTMQAPHTVVLTEASFESSSECASLTINWNAFIDAVETKTDFLLFTAKRFCYFIPKRACASEAECGLIRTLIANEVGFDKKRGT